MANQDNGKVRAIAWGEIFPWLGIFRTFRVAIGVRLLLLAAAGILMTIVGWGLIGWLLSSSDESAGQACPWLAITDMVPDQPGLGSIRQIAEPDTWLHLVRPFSQLFVVETGFLDATRSLLSGLWSLAVWAFFGAAITRSAAVQFTSDERISWTEMFHFAQTKWSAYFGAPLLPLLGVLLAVVPMAILGLIMRAGVGVLLLSIIWPVFLAGGLVMSVFLLGLIFGWPLMWATISTEGSDSFDALSRSYAYVFQRPLHYLFYVVVAALFGILGWLLVSNFAAAAIQLTYWATSWGSGAEQTTNILNASSDLGRLGYAGAAVIGFWVGCVKILAVAFLYSYFWTAATMIYLLLRRDVDATEMDEVFREEDESEPPYGLPPLETNEAGAPVVEEPTAPPTSDDASQDA